MDSRLMKRGLRAAPFCCWGRTNGKQTKIHQAAQAAWPVGRSPLHGLRLLAWIECLQAMGRYFALRLRHRTQGPISAHPGQVHHVPERPVLHLQLSYCQPLQGIASRLFRRLCDPRGSVVHLPGSRHHSHKRQPAVSVPSQQTQIRTLPRSLEHLERQKAEGKQRGFWAVVIGPFQCVRKAANRDEIVKGTT